METANKLTYLSTKFFTENKEEYRITVTVSLDDDCRSNMCDWSVTADVRRKINVDNTRSIWEAAVTMKLQNIFRNWQNSYRCIFVTIMVLLCIRWKMAYITLEEVACL